MFAKYFPVLEESTEPENYEFAFSKVRTNCRDYDADFPLVHVIRSKAELDKYCEENKELYDFDRTEEAEMGEENLYMLCEKYNESCFETKSLVLIVLKEAVQSGISLPMSEKAKMAYERF